jgi:hypothetical protein
MPLSGKLCFGLYISRLSFFEFGIAYKGKGGYVTLKDNTSLEVSTRRKDLFLKKIETI